MHATCTLFFLSRGPGVPLPEDELLLSLVPRGASVDRERVHHALVELRLVELPAWAWLAVCECNWSVIRDYNVSARLEIEDAVERNVVRLSSTVVEHPEGQSSWARVVAAIRRAFMSSHQTRTDRDPQPQHIDHEVPTATPAPLVEREATAILEDLEF